MALCGGALSGGRHLWGGAMVCGLACLSQGGGRLEDILRQQCEALGELLDVPLAPGGGGGPAIGLIGFVRSTDSIFKSPKSEEKFIRKQGQQWRGWRFCLA